MTATSVFVPARRARAHGVDLLVMRVSMAALLWARRRADRAERADCADRAAGRDELVRLRALQLETERREHASALRAARVR